MQNVKTSLAAALIFTLSACSVQQKISRDADRLVLQQPELTKAHIGVALYDVATGKYIFDHQSDKYFLPASNTKILTCYAAMKYLGDSIKGLIYGSSDGQVWIQPTGDPTFLHPDFSTQTVRNFLLQDTSKTYQWINPLFNTTALGNGWAWNDYQQDYMPERSSFPVLGNVMRLRYEQGKLQYSPSNIEFLAAAGNDKLVMTADQYTFRRETSGNRLLFVKQNGATGFKRQDIPFITSNDFVQQALQAEIKGLKLKTYAPGYNNGLIPVKDRKVIYSQATDSLLKPMMYRSDNFFAEQTLLMVSMEKLGLMNERKLIDTLLTTDLADLPQRPNWVDGSGLSRYNLFTPQDMVKVLEKIHNEFSWNRITGIFPTGGTGTIGSLYQHLAGSIFAKTGTLSGQVALSGYLVTKRKRTIIFSVLVNNHQTSALSVRKAVAAFLTRVYERY